MMTMNWVRDAKTAKVIVTLEIDEEDFFRVRLTGLDTTSLAKKLEAFAAMAKDIEIQDKMGPFFDQKRVDIQKMFNHQILGTDEIVAMFSKNWETKLRGPAKVEAMQKSLHPMMVVEYNKDNG